VLLPVLLTLLGVGAALLPAALGFPDPPDLVPLAALALGAAWSTFVWRRGPSRRRLAGMTAQWVAAGGITWWMLAYSAYGDAKKAPRIGDRAPAITAVRVRDGAGFDLKAERGHQTLLVFFRGRW
jgi:hypothetical protein